MDVPDDAVDFAAGFDVFSDSDDDDVAPAKTLESKTEDPPAPEQK